MAGGLAGDAEGKMGGTRIGAGGRGPDGWHAGRSWGSADGLGGHGPSTDLPRIPKSSDADRKTPMLVELCAETEPSQQITIQPSHPCSNKCRLKYSSRFWSLRVSLANYTLTDLLLLSASAILVNYIYI